MDKERVDLPLNEIPAAWYNVLADLPKPLPPPLHPGTGQPLTPVDLAPLFPMALIEQEMSPERWIPVPEGIRELYKIWRPTPLVRATRLEKALKTSCRIYFKNESVSPPGSHKLNTALAQAYYNKLAGVRRICTETGAGQWGSALAFACQVFGLECTIYMVKSSYHQKPYRRSLMHIWGGKVYASPSRHTRAGRAILAADPKSPGSLGIAISEAVEDAATHDDAKYSLGSVLNHVLLHQTVIGLETKRQLELIGEKPDVNLISQTIVSAVEEQSATVGEIAKTVGGASAAAGEIAKNVAESAQGLAEVSSNIQGVKQAAENTSTGIQQVRTGTQELAKLSAQLQGIVKQFKI